MIKVAEILEGALNKLSAQGWYQGDLNGPDGSMCAMSAVWKVEPHDSELARTAIDILAKHVPENFIPPQGDFKNPVAQYNDDPGTSIEDINLLFKKAINDAYDANL